MSEPASYGIVAMTRKVSRAVANEIYKVILDRKELFMLSACPQAGLRSQASEFWPRTGQGKQGVPHVATRRHQNEFRHSLWSIGLFYIFIVELASFATALAPCYSQTGLATATGYSQAIANTTLRATWTLYSPDIRYSIGVAVQSESEPRRCNLQRRNITVDINSLLATPICIWRLHHFPP